MNADLTVANNQFSLDLLRQLNRGPTQQVGQATDVSHKQLTNVFVSPFNIAQVLSILLLGCEGKTKSELSTVLHFKDDGSYSDGVSSALLGDMNTALLESATLNKLTLKIGNGIYPDKLFILNPNFTKTATSHFKAVIQNLNYLQDSKGAEKKINDDVTKLTHGKITELIPQGTLNEYTQLVVTSAIYFKGDWSDKFDAKLTENIPFTQDDGVKIDIPMMRGIKKCWFGQLDLAQGDDGFKTPQSVKILRLDYVNKGKGQTTQTDKAGFSMYIILPEQGKLVNLINEVDATKLKNIMTKHLSQHDKVRVTIPKFKVNYDKELKETLRSLGLVEIFSPNANLSGLVKGSTSTHDNQRLYLSKVFHKAFLEVNEEGSIAAAATAGVVMVRAMLVQLEFTADRPFLYIIADNTNSHILFIGTFSHP